jgi:tellurite resistance-related uncharacterized protein
MSADDDAFTPHAASGPLPAGIRLVRTTPEFDERTAPAGFAKAHRIAVGVWGRLRVTEGHLGFQFEDTEEVVEIAAGTTLMIPPQRPHHLVLEHPVRFVVEFYRPITR